MYRWGSVFSDQCACGVELVCLHCIELMDSRERCCWHDGSCGSNRPHRGTRSGWRNGCDRPRGAKWCYRSAGSGGPDWCNRSSWSNRPWGWSDRANRADGSNWSCWIDRTCRRNGNSRYDGSSWSHGPDWFSGCHGSSRCDWSGRRDGSCWRNGSLWYNGCCGRDWPDRRDRCRGRCGGNRPGRTNWPTRSHWSCWIEWRDCARSECRLELACGRHSELHQRWLFG